MNDLRTFLRDNPVFWSRLGFCYDPPRTDKDGKQIVFSKEYGDYVRIHRDFEKAGVKLHTTILPSGWIGDGVFDYALTDEILNALFQNDPDIYYMPRVKLNVPVDWCRNHPDDTFVYYFGPRNTEDIRELVGTDKHDWFGFESDGYAVNGGKGTWKDDRVNRGGCIGLQSFSSLKWIEDAKDALQRLMLHLARSKYADRIIGVHIAYGMCGETNIWGAWSPLGQGHRGDFGINNRKRFKEYCTDKYGSAENAIKILGTLEIPAPAESETPKKTLEELFFAENDIRAEYFSFISKTNAEAAEEFCRSVKENGQIYFKRELAAGVFYGYMYLPQSPNAGQLAIDKMIASPYIDFMSSPKGYFRCLAGDPGGEQGPSESIAKKIVWLDEIDDHTHLDRRPNGRAKDLNESKTLLWREALKNITHGQGFWWMDLGEGWYDCPELMKDITDITSIQKALSKTEHTSVAEVLLVVDDCSLSKMSISYGLCVGLLYQLHSELKLIGAPVDTLRLCDLYDTELTNYKFIVFANCFTFKEGERERLLGLLKGKNVLWHYTAGILAPGLDPKNYTALTGFELKEFERTDPDYYGYPPEYYEYDISHEHRAGDFPLFSVYAPDMKIIKRYPNGQANCAVKGKTAVCATPCLDSKELRELAKLAGVNIWCDTDCTVFADNRITGIFPKKDFCGEIFNGENISKINIPANGKYIKIL